MAVRFKKPHTAFRHGAYSATAVLPGEDEEAFRELHQKIIAELAPVGALEEDLVGTIARVLWRKQNLAILRIVEFAREHGVEFRAERPSFRMERLLDQTREELGEDYELVEIGETATVGRLLEDLQVEEKLDATIDKCLKRLLFLRGSRVYHQPHLPRRHNPFQVRRAFRARKMLREHSHLRFDQPTEPA
jgi:hypothetical protein